MARTQISGRFIEDQSVERADINTTTSGKSLITKVIVNSPLTISSTGVDSGTGDVTLGLNTSTLVTSFNSRTGAVTLNGTDVTNALGFVPISGESDTLDSVLTRGNTTTKSITLKELILRNGSYSSNIGFGLINSPGSDYLDFLIKNNSGIRFGALDFDGAAFQGFGANHPSFPGQIYFDYGSALRTVANRAAYFRNLNGPATVTMTLTESSNVIIKGNTDTGEALQVNGDIKSTGTIKSMYQAGNEGGEITLNIPATNTNLNTSVTIDVYQNKLRIFESGGINRGGYFDLSNLNAGVGTNFVPTGYNGNIEVMAAIGTPGGSKYEFQINNGIITNVILKP